MGKPAIGHRTTGKVFRKQFSTLVLGIFPYNSFQPKLDCSLFSMVFVSYLCSCSSHLLLQLLVCQFLNSEFNSFESQSESGDTLFLRTQQTITIIAHNCMCPSFLHECQVPKTRMFLVLFLTWYFSILSE